MVLKRLLGIAAATLLPVTVHAGWSGNLALELRGFTSDGLYYGQENGGLSLSFQPEYRYQWNDGNNGFTFIPFMRLDSMDDERPVLRVLIVDARQ